MSFFQIYWNLCYINWYWSDFWYKYSEIAINKSFLLLRIFLIIINRNIQLCWYYRFNILEHIHFQSLISILFYYNLFKWTILRKNIQNDFEKSFYNRLNDSESLYRMTSKQAFIIDWMTMKVEFFVSNVYYLFYVIFVMEFFLYSWSEFYFLINIFYLIFSLEQRSWMEMRKIK